MTLRKAWGWRLATFFTGAGSLILLALAQQSCMRRVDQPEAQLLASEVDQVQSIIRVFRKIIGRDPGQKEIQALKPFAYPDLVKAVLGSGQFEMEGFYNLHRERFLLNREGSQGWVKNSYNDYCALRLEMTEQAIADRDGKYFDMLRYQERWLPLANMGLDECYFGVTVADVIAAKALGEDVDFGQLTPKQRRARTCVENIRWQLPGEPGGDEGGGDDSEARFNQFFAMLDALSDADKAKSLLEIPEGEKIFVRIVRDTLFPQWFEFPAGAPQPAEMQIELAKKDGKLALLQEMGADAHGQCLFVPLAPADYQPKPQPDWGGGGFGGGGIEPFEPVFPPPIDVEPLVGDPVEPAIFPADVVNGDDPNAPVAGGIPLAEMKPTGPLYLKVKMPKEYMGVHASPYWLSRHPSKPKNRNLHRARVMYFSYFCADINPDAANFVGPPITEFPPELKPYFAPDDEHVKGSQNCYNCHTKVQPLANYFGLASYGTQYDFGGGFEGDDDDDGGGFDFQMWPQFMPQDGAFDRPGGIWDGVAFYEHDGSNKGMEGMANVLSKYPKVRQCIADSTWGAMVGRDFPLWEDERAAAVAAFEKGGKPSLTRLIDHLMLENERGKTFFTKGEAAFAKIKPTAEFECPDQVTEAIEVDAAKVAKSTCKTCHEGEFITEDGKLDVDFYFSEENDEDTPETRGELWHQLYCKVKTEKMPPGGSGAALEKSLRGAFWCKAMRQRDELASAGTIPASYKAKACPGAPAPASGMGAPHAVNGGNGH